MKNQKKALVEQDVILVYIDNNPAFFARVENIIPDVKRGWWRIKLLILHLPLVVTSWILDEEQIRGADFTMGGTQIRIEKVIAPAEPASSVPNADNETGHKSKPDQEGRILSLHRGTKK